VAGLDEGARGLLVGHVRAVAAVVGRVANHLRPAVGQVDAVLALRRLTIVGLRVCRVVVARVVLHRVRKRVGLLRT